jgi:hypothetical protein
MATGVSPGHPVRGRAVPGPAGGLRRVLSGEAEHHRGLRQGRGHPGRPLLHSRPVRGRLHRPVAQAQDPRDHSLDTRCRGAAGAAGDEGCRAVLRGRAGRALGQPAAAHDGRSRDPAPGPGRGPAGGELSRHRGRDRDHPGRDRGGGTAFGRGRFPRDRRDHRARMDARAGTGGSDPLRSPAAPECDVRVAARRPGPGRARTARRRTATAPDAAGPGADHLDHARAVRAGTGARGVAGRVPGAVQGGRRFVLLAGCRGRRGRRTRPAHRAAAGSPAGTPGPHLPGVPRLGGAAGRGGVRHRPSHGAGGELHPRTGFPVDEGPGRHDDPGGHPRRLPGTGLRHLRHGQQHGPGDRGGPRHRTAPRTHRDHGGGRLGGPASPVGAGHRAVAAPGRLAHRPHVRGPWRWQGWKNR